MGLGELLVKWGHGLWTGSTGETQTTAFSGRKLEAGALRSRLDLACLSVLMFSLNNPEMVFPRCTGFCLDV